MCLTAFNWQRWQGVTYYVTAWYKRGLLNVVHMGGHNIADAQAGSQINFSESLPWTGRCFLIILLNFNFKNLDLTVFSPFYLISIENYATKPNIPMVIQASKPVNHLTQTNDYIGCKTNGKQFCFCWILV